MSNDRRKFMHRLSSAGAAAALAGAFTGVFAAGPEAGKGQGMGKAKGAGRSAHAFVMAADTQNKCATCVFWGGQRHVSRDKSAVHAMSLGMCNNPASMNYHRTTSPDTGPMAAWVKWPALDA